MPKPRKSPRGAGCGQDGEVDLDDVGKQLLIKSIQVSFINQAARPCLLVAVRNYRLPVNGFKRFTTVY
jgi:hypothetical protein